MTAKLGKCVHCLKDSVPLTKDHVFPKSWYPKNATKDLFKWQIPACQPCNASYGRLENELKSVLGICVDPRVAQAAGILESARRAMDPSAAGTTREADARAALRKKLQGRVLVGSEIPSESILPGFGERWERQPKDQLGILVAHDSLCRLTEKIVRGIYYLRDGRFIEPPYYVHFHAIQQPAPPQILALFEGSEVTAHEPGICVRRAILDDPFTAILEIEVWGTFKLYASVDRNE